MTKIHDSFLYHQVADRIGQMIEQGVLKTGDKLMSIRNLCKEQNISHSTAFMAYAALEHRGLIESRPKSGYYVRYSPKQMPPLQRDKTAVPVLARLTLEQVISDLYDKMSETGVMQFSMAAPDVSLLPMAKLNKCMMAALRHSEGGCLHYADVAGSDALRRQVARLAYNWGGKPNPEEIVITNGCMEALSLCLQAVTKPGDWVAIESPTYFGIANLLKSLHLNALEVPTDPVNGIDLDFLRDTLVERPIAACLFIPTFSNPAGSLMPDAAKKDLVELLAAEGVPLIEDDLYGEMYFGKERPHTCKSFDKTGNVLYCSSFSKSLAPGYRIGWCIPGRHISKLRQLKLTYNISTATPLQDALAIFCESGHYNTHLRQLRRSLHTQCLRYAQAIAQYFPKNICMSRPHGGYVLWIELPPDVDALEVYHRARLQKITVAPGHLFSLSSRYEHYIRIGFGAPFTKDVEERLKRVGDIIKKIGGS
jgi:DNA-binding transcriptional MocR family regulator